MVVVDRRRPLVRLDHRQVHAPVLRRARRAQADAREHVVPRGRVVHAGLPRVAQRREPAAVAIALAVEVVVPGAELRLKLAKEGERRLAVARALVDAADGRGVQRRLDDPGRARVGGGVGRARRLPHRGAREVAVARSAEHDVRHEAVRPLPLEQRAELRARALLVAARQADRDQRRVPAPLVRVEVRSRARAAPEPVAIEDSLRRVDEGRFVHGYGAGVRRSRADRSRPRRRAAGGRSRRANGRTPRGRGRAS